MKNEKLQINRQTYIFCFQKGIKISLPLGWFQPKHGDTATLLSQLYNNYIFIIYL